jgi:hypothetical protein
MDDDYVPPREEPVDASWLEPEIERLAQEHDEWERQCDEVEHEVIALVRAAGWSWRSVGETIGVSAPVLHRRFAREDVPARQRRRG